MAAAVPIGPFGETLAHPFTHLALGAFVLPFKQHTHPHPDTVTHFHLLPALALWGGNPNGSAAREAHLQLEPARGATTFSLFYTAKRAIYV